jgi:hypothetical protein
MAKKTLLDMTQNILNAMDSDEVNSIGDTVESLQVAEVIRETYEYITVGLDIPGRAGVIMLDACSDPDRPNHMTVPSNVERLEWIRYNGEEVVYKDPLTFVNYVAGRGNGDEVESIEGLNIYNDRDPCCYTSFDDDTLVFDAYDNEAGATLMQSKTLCWGQRSLPFLMEDDFIPTLPLDMFPRLLAEAKAACFVNYKQVANSTEERRARNQKVVNMNSRFKAGTVKPIDRLPNYGRKR